MAEKTKAKKAVPKKAPAKSTAPNKAAPKKAAAKKAAPKKAAKAKKVPQKKAREYIKGSKKVNLYDLKGKSVKQVTLPRAFDESYRPDLIRKAVNVARANRQQPYGPSPMSGMQHAVSTWGKGRGVARVQRLTQGRNAAESPNNVGGRRAHPPKPWQDRSEKINRKERRKARNSALGAVATSDIVRTRGHRFSQKLTLPLVLDDKFQDLEHTKDVVDVLEKLGIYRDVERSEKGKHIRAGKGKMRGRRYKTPRSILIVTADGVRLNRGATNLSGVDVVNASNLNTEHLAPGGDPGRLTLFTESALKDMGDW